MPSLPHLSAQAAQLTSLCQTIPDRMAMSYEDNHAQYHLPDTYPSADLTNTLRYPGRADWQTFFCVPVSYPAQIHAALPAQSHMSAPPPVSSGVMHFSNLIIKFQNPFSQAYDSHLIYHFQSLLQKREYNRYDNLLPHNKTTKSQ